MNIQKCYLDTENSFPINNSTVSKLISKGAHKALWEERKLKIDTIIIHYMSAIEFYKDNFFDINNCIDVLLKFDVSAHYIIDRFGTVYQLVPDDKKAWHCGGSIMPEPDNRTGVNEFSIGIELVATDVSGFTEDQYGSLNALISQISQIHKIKNIIGHDEISGTCAVEMGLRKDVKVDPGELFDWGKIKKLNSVD